MKNNSPGGGSGGSGGGEGGGIASANPAGYKRVKAIDGEIVWVKTYALIPGVPVTP